MNRPSHLRLVQGNRAPPVPKPKRRWKPELGAIVLSPELRPLARTPIAVVASDIVALVPKVITASADVHRRFVSFRAEIAQDDDTRSVQILALRLLDGRYRLGATGFHSLVDRSLDRKLRELAASIKGDGFRRDERHEAIKQRLGVTQAEAVLSDVSGQVRGKVKVLAALRAKSRDDLDAKAFVALQVLEHTSYATDALDMVHSVRTDGADLASQRRRKLTLVRH